jgi:hypothetical protein
MMNDDLIQKKLELLRPHPENLGICLLDGTVEIIFVLHLDLGIYASDLCHARNYESISRHNLQELQSIYTAAFWQQNYFVNCFGHAILPD